MSNAAPQRLSTAGEKQKLLLLRRQRLPANTLTRYAKAPGYVWAAVGHVTPETFAVCAVGPHSCQRRGAAVT